MALEENSEVQYPCVVLAGFDGLSEDAMAHVAWVTTGTKWCDKMQAEAHMLERRVYPAEFMPDFPGYRVTSKKCSLGTACNLAGYPCKWAYFELNEDPFKPTV